MTDFSIEEFKKKHPDYMIREYRYWKWGLVDVVKSLGSMGFVLSGCFGMGFMEDSSCWSLNEALKAVKSRKFVERKFLCSLLDIPGAWFSRYGIVGDCPVFDYMCGLSCSFSCEKFHFAWMKKENGRYVWLWRLIDV